MEASTRSISSSIDRRTSSSSSKTCSASSCRVRVVSSVCTCFASSQAPSPTPNSTLATRSDLQIGPFNSTGLSQAAQAVRPSGIGLQAKRRKSEPGRWCAVRSVRAHQSLQLRRQDQDRLGQVRVGALNSLKLYLPPDWMDGCIQEQTSGKTNERAFGLKATIPLPL